MSATKQMEDAVFYAAVSIADAEQRLHFLDQACAGNTELRAAVAEMLEAHIEADSFFKKGIAALALPQEDLPVFPPDEAERVAKPDVDKYLGTFVGRYKLLQRIGEGGCGVVYMAEQEQPVRILKTCLLYPPDPALNGELARMARVMESFFDPIPKEKFPPWPFIYMALWEYRRGDYLAVDDWCKHGAERSVHLAALNSTLKIIEAMSAHRQGKNLEANRQLASERQTIEVRFEAGMLQGDNQGSWYDWVFARVLLREATSLIAAGDASMTGITAQK